MQTVTDYKKIKCSKGPSKKELQYHCRWWLQPWNYKMLAPWKKSYDQRRLHIKTRDITLPTKVWIVKAKVFPVVMYGCENWTIKKAERWRTDASELWYWRRLESPLDCKEIQPVHPKGDQSWVFIGRTDAEAETPILWPPDAKSCLIRKDPDAGKDWRQEEKGTTEDEMAGWHQQLHGREFEQAPGDGEGQGSLACCSPWSRKEWMDGWMDWPPPTPPQVSPWRRAVVCSFKHTLGIRGLSRWH